MLNRVSVQLGNLTGGDNNNFKRSIPDKILKALVEPITPSPPPPPPPPQTPLNSFSHAASNGAHVDRSRHSVGRDIYR